MISLFGQRLVKMNIKAAIYTFFIVIAIVAFIISSIYYVIPSVIPFACLFGLIIMGFTIQFIYFIYIKIEDYLEDK